MTNAKTFTAEELKTMVEEVNAWSGALENLEFYTMESLNEILCNEDIEKIISMVQYGDFSINDELFGFDGLGNLESLTEIEYQDLLKEYRDEIVEAYEYEVENGNIEDSYNFLGEIINTAEMVKQFCEVEKQVEKSNLIFWDYKEVLYNIIGGSREVFEALYDNELSVAVSRMEYYGIDFESLKDTHERLSRALGI